MVMLRVFCRLDAAVEEIWIEKHVEQRQAFLGLPRSEFCFANRGEQRLETADIDGKGMMPTRWRGKARHALEAAKNQAGPLYGQSVKSSILQLLRSRA